MHFKRNLAVLLYFMTFVIGHRAHTVYVGLHVPGYHRRSHHRRHRHHHKNGHKKREDGTSAEYPNELHRPGMCAIVVKKISFDLI